MIEASITIGDGRRMDMEMDGHAGAGDAGHDLVCAAASILAQAAVVSLCEDRDARGADDRLQCNWLLQLGHAEISVKARGKWRNIAKGKMQMLADGLQLLQDAFPEAIHVRRE